MFLPNSCLDQQIHYQREPSIMRPRLSCVKLQHMSKPGSSLTKSWVKLTYLCESSCWLFFFYNVNGHGHDSWHPSYSSQRQDDRLKDPPVINRKGRPLTQCFTSALEGRPRGGGAGGNMRISNANVSAISKRQGVRCGVCRKTGHNRTTCPILHP